LTGHKSVINLDGPFGEQLKIQFEELKFKALRKKGIIVIQIIALFSLENDNPRISNIKLKQLQAKYTNTFSLRLNTESGVLSRAIQVRDRYQSGKRPSLISLSAPRHV